MFIEGDNKVIIKSEGKKDIVIGIDMIPALVCVDVEKRYEYFATSNDGAYNRDFLREILSYAYIEDGDSKTYLNTDYVINSTFSSWKDIDNIFSEVLRVNDIQRNKQKEYFSDQFSKAGAAMAVAFLSACEEFMLPTVEHFERKHREGSAG